MDVICPLAFLNRLVASFFFSCGLDEGERSREVHLCPHEVFEKSGGITVCFPQKANGGIGFPQFCLSSPMQGVCSFVFS